MGAIDLLFTINDRGASRFTINDRGATRVGAADAERLHQLAINALLCHSPLLRRLAVVPPGQGGLIDQHGPPQASLYDLALRLRDGSQLFVEIKVDGACSDEQLRRQLQELRAEGHAEDRVLYLLLGYSAITTAPRITATASEVGVAPERVLIRGAEEVAVILGDPGLLWGASAAQGDASARDARDLAIAYRDHLLALSQRVAGFFDRAPADWRAGDYYGFFAHCRSRIAAMSGAEIDYEAAPPGGFIGCLWGIHALAGGVRLYLQYEGPRLCVKVDVEPSERRGALRDLACNALLRLSPPAPLQIVRPARLGHGRRMTLAYVEGVPFGQAERFGEQEHGLQAAATVVGAVAAKLTRELGRQVASRSP